MTSMRRRTLALVLGLMLLGTLAMTLFNYFDSTHEVEEIYDAQLAHSARLLQGLMRTPVREEERAGLYRAFNEALAQAGQRSKPGHPYESKLAFQVWDASGHLLVHSAGPPHWKAHRSRRELPRSSWVRTSGAASCCAIPPLDC